MQLNDPTTAQLCEEWRAQENRACAARLVAVVRSAIADGEAADAYRCIYGTCCEVPDKAAAMLMVFILDTIDRNIQAGDPT